MSEEEDDALSRQREAYRSAYRGFSISASSGARIADGMARRDYVDRQVSGETRQYVDRALSVGHPDTIRRYNERAYNASQRDALNASPFNPELAMNAAGNVELNREDYMQGVPSNGARETTEVVGENAERIKALEAEILELKEENAELVEENVLLEKLNVELSADTGLALSK